MPVKKTRQTRNYEFIHTSTSSTLDEECEYKKGWQRRLNRDSPSQWTNTSKANEGGDVALDITTTVVIREHGSSININKSSVVNKKKCAHAPCTGQQLVQLY